MSAPSERAAAKAAGLARYTTGRPCSRGHVAERFTASGSCVACRQLLDHEKKRAKKQVVQPAKERSAEDNISVVAYEGTNFAAEAFRWVDAQAARLGVSSSFITDGVRNGWSLIEIERLPIADAMHLADRVNEHMAEDGFTRFEDAASPYRDIG